MKIYKNSNYTDLITDNILDLGIGLAGHSYVHEYYLENDLKAELTDINFVMDSKEVKIISFPSHLQALEKSVLKLQWTPDVDIKAGLKTEITITGFELWG